MKHAIKLYSKYFFIFIICLFKNTHLQMLFNSEPLVTVCFYCRPFLLCLFLFKNAYLRMLFNSDLLVATCFHCRLFLLCLFLFKNTHVWVLFNDRPLVNECFLLQTIFTRYKCRIMQHTLSIKFFIFDDPINKAYSLTFGSKIYFYSSIVWCNLVFALEIK